MHTDKIKILSQYDLKVNFLIIFSVGCLAFILSLMLQYNLLLPIIIIIGLFGLFLSLIDGYYGLIIIIIGQPLLFLGIEPPGFSILKILYAVFFVSWYIGWLLRHSYKKNVILDHPLKTSVFWLGLLLAVGLVMGTFFSESVNFIVRDASQYLGYLAVLPAYYSVKTKKRAKTIFQILLFLGLLGFVFNWLFWINQKQQLDLGLNVRILRFSIYYWYPFVGVIYSYFLLPSEQLGNTSHKRFFALVYVVLSVILTVYIGMRSLLLAELTTILGAVIFINFLKYKKMSFGTQFSVFILMGVVVAWLYLGTLGELKIPGIERNIKVYQTLFDKTSFLEDLSAQGRIAEMEASIDAWRKNPILGVGLGYNLQFLWWDNKTIWKEQFNYHVGYTEILTKFGIIGIIVFFVFFMNIIKLCIRIMKSDCSQTIQLYTMGFLILIFRGLVTSVSGSAFSDKGFALTVGVLAGILPLFCDDRLKETNV